MVEAQFAQPLLIATALVHGKIGIADVDGLGDEAVLALSDRIVGVARERRRPRFPRITVRRIGGRSATVEATDPNGSPQKPPADARLEATFRDCAANALRPLSPAVVDATLTAIAHFEDLSDARQLITPFIA